MIVTGKTALHDKLAAVETAVRGEVLNADEQLAVALLGIVGRANVFYIGLPGLAKSMLVDRIRARVDCRQFKKQFSPFTKDGEVLGPLSIPGLQQERQYRVTDGFLPWADWVVLDEVFNANSAVLNALQELILEGTWHNDGQTVKAPLNMVFAMSNRLPGADRDELNAFYDRLLLRFEVPSEMSRQDLLGLIDLPEPDPSPPTLLTMDDVLAIQAEAAALPIGADAAAAALDIRDKVHESGHWTSPRRFRAGVTRVARAAAWLDGSSEVEAVHMEALAHVMWDKPDQRPGIERIVIEVCSPNNSEVLALEDRFSEVREQVDRLVAERAAGEGSETLMNQVIDSLDKLKQVAADVLEFESGKVTGRAATALARVRGDVTEAAAELGVGIMRGNRDIIVQGLWADAQTILSERTRR